MRTIKKNPNRRFLAVRVERFVMNLISIYYYPVHNIMLDGKFSIYCNIIMEKWKLLVLTVI
jgi:hypothetical protein